MASRQSTQDQDGLVWNTVGMPLGEVGLDLRQPVTPRSLTKLINARFIDERSVRRRDGHLGQQVVDSSDYPAIGNIGTAGWIYGHGQKIDPTNPLARGQMHHPVAGQARATFNFDGADVVWTGDRLLVLREDGNPALGQHTFWRRDAGTTPLARGIPAHLPLQVDSTPPDTISGSIVETCLTPTLRVIVAPDSAGKLYGWIIDRSTGAVINKSELGGVSGLDSVHVINSGGVPFVVWRNGDNTLCTNYWTGVQWVGKTTVDTGVSSISVALVTGGFHVAWITGGGLTVKVGRYFGSNAQSTPYVFGTTLPINGAAVASHIALAVNPDGGLTVAAWVASDPAGLTVRAYTASADGSASTSHRLLTGISYYDLNSPDAVTITTRGLKNSAGYYPVVVYSSLAGYGAHAYEVQAPANESVASFSQFNDSHRYNSVLASHAFCVGDETFAWLRATNASTDYLVAGVMGQVCGYADREEAYVRNSTLSQVVPDPLSATGTAWTWARPFITVQVYARAGNARIGDIEFLPPLSVARYGKSAYLSGSAVRNWDGIQLGDAGFQDYPKIVSATPAGSGGSLSAGSYQFRAYLVRYNARGERFQSAALTFPSDSSRVTAVLNDKVVLSIATVPDVNHADAQIEVYRTIAGGTTFYYDGSIANDLTAGTVTYNSTRSDASIANLSGNTGNPADPFATGVGNVSEIENWGPLGCAVLAVVGDRLWGCGGQVPAGFAQFSKLKEDGSGVGFDDLSELEEVNTAGETIYSIIGYGDAVIFLEKNRIDVLAGTGPDNNGVGSWGVPQMTLADGAVTHLGTIVTQVGVVYWGVDGPRLLDQAFRVQNISLPIHDLTATMTPSGVVVDHARQEVVWYTEGGTAVLWNYVGGRSRWAQWSGLPVAGVSDTALVEPDGWFLKESPTAHGDNGRVFAFSGCTSELSHDDLLGGATALRTAGIVGAHLGDHQLIMRVYYNGSPLWSDEWTWQPDTGSWLVSGTDLGTDTPAQIDALYTDVDRSGQYATHKRVSRPNCRTFRVEWSDVNSDSPTFVPYELSFEMGTRGGLGRVPVNTFGA